MAILIGSKILASDIVNGLGKVQTGSYTGTGASGSSRKNSITFNFTPKFVLFFGGCHYAPKGLGEAEYSGANTGFSFWINTDPNVIFLGPELLGFRDQKTIYTSDYTKASLSGNTLYFWTETGSAQSPGAYTQSGPYGYVQNASGLQLNVYNLKYRWVAFG